MAGRFLQRRDPYLSDLFQFRRNFDDLFTQMLQPLGVSSSEQQLNLGWVPAMECSLDQSQNKYHVRLALPGVKPDEVNIQVHGNELTISGERRQESEQKQRQYLQREFSYGAFERSIALPEGIDPDKIEARFEQGVLNITVPLSEKAQPKRIQIQGGESQPRQVSAKAEKAA